MSEEINFDDVEFGEPIEEKEPTYRDGYIRGIYRARNIIDSKQKEIERLNQEIRCLNNCIIEFHSEFCNKQAEINRLNKIRQQVIDELFELKNMIYKPETREINFDVQRKISSMIVKLGSDKE